MRRSLVWATAIAAACATGALLSSPAHSEGPTWRDGWCAPGEGQSVVVDWHNVDGATPTVPGKDGNAFLVRCVLVDPAASYYPVDVYPATVGVLAAAGLSYRQTGGIVTSINGIQPVVTSGTSFWRYITGKDGAWLGAENWAPDPGIPFVGITANSATDVNAVPQPLPQFAAPSMTPTPTATPSTSGTPTGTPTTTSTPTRSSSATATSTATASTSVAPTRSAPSSSPASTTRTSRPESSTTPPRRTTPPTRPSTQPPTTPPPPSATSTPTPKPPTSQSPNVSHSPTPSDASPSPTLVWGREDARRSDPSPAPESPTSPWAGLATIGFGALTLGGVSWAFSSSLRAGKPEEDE